MKPPVKKEVSLEEKKRLLLKICKTKKELQAWIKYFLNLQMPEVQVSRYATVSPLDAIWEIYKICVLRQNPENIQEVLYTASRGGGKTLGAAIAEFMVMLHDQRDIAHVGAISAQAARAYDYVKGFCSLPNVKPIIDPANVKDEDKILQKSTMSKSVFNINGTPCTMEILPATMKALNGVHVSLCSVDELDTLKGEGLIAIKEIAGMLDTKNGRKPLKVGISTRKSKHGIMNRMIENADKEGRVLRFWTALEFTERCPDSRSGIEPTPYWLNQSTGECLSPAEYAKKEAVKQKEFEHESGMFDKCKTCPAAVFCRGDAKKQTSTSNMLKSIDELNQKIKSEGFDWAASQLFNLKPSSEGTVFREFEERLHVKNWNEMWLKLTDKEFPGDCTHDMFVKKCHEMKLSCFAGIDWGFSNPNTVVYFFVDKRDNIFVVRADGMTYTSEPNWIHYLKTKYHTLYRCQLYSPDPANQGAILEMQKAGLPTANENKGEINAGIQVLKKFLKVPGSPEPKLLIAKETCKPLIDEFQSYHYKTDAAGLPTDIPEDNNNHWIDAFRYMMTLLFGRTVIILGQGLDLDNASDVMDPNGSYKRMPSPAEFAAISGIPMSDTAPDTSKLGKIGSAKDLEDDPDDDPEGSGGGFLWST